MRITATNRGPDPHRLCLLPTLWFRNDWSWSAGSAKPWIAALSDTVLEAGHPTLGPVRLVAPGTDRLLFCDNETNGARLYGTDGPAYPKDGINDHSSTAPPR